MWNFFKKEPKKPVRKKIVKKTKPASKTSKSSNPLDILDRTLDKKLKEIQGDKTSLQKIKKEASTKQVKKSLSDKKAHIDKPADINFTQKIPKKSSHNKNITSTSGKKETVQRNDSHFVQVLNDSIQDVVNGVLFSGVIDLKIKRILYQTSGNIYNISDFEDFINRFLDLTESKRANAPYLLIDLEKDVFLYLQIFKQHYYIMLIDKNEMSIGHILNILKPQLIQNYHQAINN